MKKFSSEREATEAQNIHGGELTDGKVIRKKNPPPKFFVGGGSRVAADGQERIDPVEKQFGSNEEKKVTSLRQV